MQSFNVEKPQIYSYDDLLRKHMMDREVRKTFDKKIPEPDNTRDNKEIKKEI